MPRDKQSNDDARTPRQRIAGRASGAILLIGTGIAAVFGSLWPGILLVMVLSLVPLLFARGGWLVALMPLAWVLGIMLIMSDLFWPGVIVIVGGTILMRTVIMRTRR